MWKNIAKAFGLTAGVATLACIGWNRAPEDGSKSYVPFSAFLNSTRSIVNVTVANATSDAEPPPATQPGFTMDDVYRMMITFVPLLSRLAAQASIDAINGARVVSSEWWFQRFPQYTAYLGALLIGCTYLDQLARAIVQATENVYGDRVGLREYFKSWASVEMARIKVEREQHKEEHELEVAKHEAQAKLNEERFDVIEKGTYEHQMEVIEKLEAEGRLLEAAKLLGMPMRPKPLPEVEVEQAEGPREGMRAIDEQRHEEGKPSASPTVEAITLTSNRDRAGGGPPGGDEGH